jgi:hypothetical protein
MHKIKSNMFTFLPKAASLLAALLFSATALLAQTGIIRGKVTDKLTNQPIAFANILETKTGKGVVTDENGQFEITGLAPGLYDVTASFIGYSDATVYEIQVSNAKPAVLSIELEEAAEQLGEVVVQASPFKKTEESPVSLRTIGVAEIQRNPGGNRDISKVLQSLPGVVSPSSFRNDLIIRGGAPNENRFFLDDVEVPNINHFATQGASGGPVGLINVNFINEVDFFSGAFPANRGNALSSVLNFRQRDGRDDRLGGTFSASPVMIGDVVMATNEAGETHVFRANPERMEPIAVNRLGTEALASPAVCGGRIYLRVAVTTGDLRQEKLFCIGNRDGDQQPPAE